MLIHLRAQVLAARAFSNSYCFTKRRGQSNLNITVVVTSLIRGNKSDRKRAVARWRHHLLLRKCSLKMPIDDGYDPSSHVAFMGPTLAAQ